MPERRNWRRIALVAAGVTAVHAWLLAMPRTPAPHKPAAAWTARTLAPPAVVLASESAAAAPAAQALPTAAPQPAPPRRVRAPAAAQAPSPVHAPQQPQEPPSAQAAPESSAAESAPPEVAVAAASQRDAPSTRASGAPPAGRFLVPPSARFNYDVTARTHGITLSGNARLDWRNDGREYEAQLTLSAPFLPSRTQRSTGLVTPQGLAPLRFSDKVRSEEATHFDRDNGKVVFSNNKPEAPLEPGIQDRLSIVLQLGAMVGGEPARYRTGSHITVQTASTKEAEPWTFTVEGPETLALPGGRVQTLRLTRNPRKEFDVKVELWLAPGSAYAPVRLRLTQPNGDWVDQQWSSTDRG